MSISEAVHWQAYPSWNQFAWLLALCGQPHSRLSRSSSPAAGGGRMGSVVGRGSGPAGVRSLPPPVGPISSHLNVGGDEKRLHR